MNNPPGTRAAGASLKHWVRSHLALVGLHGYTSASLPTGVNWLHDVCRSGLLPEVPVCFDVGANVGQTVIELRAALPKALIHAFEPFTQPYAQLQVLCTQFEGPKSVPLALGAAPGQMQVSPRPQSVLNSLRSDTTVAGSDTTEWIRIDTADAYCREQGLTRIDVFKTDTEGYDLEVLRGAEGLLRAHQVLFVFVEVTFDRNNTQNTPFQPVFEHLQERDYRFLGLYDTYPLHHFAEPNLFCNALFVARSHWKASA
jgi:FkbM family methyltransferase